MKDLLDFFLGRLKEVSRTRKLRNFEDADFLLNLKAEDKITFPVACAVILSDLALIDGEFHVSEYQFLFSKLEEDLGIGADEAQEVMKQARFTLAAGRGSLGYAAYIKKTFTLEQREQIYTMVEGMVAADEKTDGFEIYLANRLRTSLGLGQ